MTYTVINRWKKGRGKNYKKKEKKDGKMKKINKRENEKKSYIRGKLKLLRQKIKNKVKNIYKLDDYYGNIYQWKRRRQSGKKDKKKSKGRK